MRTFGHKRVVRDYAGNVIDVKDSPVGAVTHGVLDGSFGCDRSRKLVVTLEAGDLIVIRPHGTQRPEKMAVQDVYRFMIRSKANLIRLEKARDVKAKKAERRASERIARADRKIREQAK